MTTTTTDAAYEQASRQITIRELEDHSTWQVLAPKGWGFWDGRHDYVVSGYWSASALRTQLVRHLVRCASNCDCLERAKMINEIYQHEQTLNRYAELTAGVQASVDQLINMLASSPSQAQSAAGLAVASARRQMLAQDQYALLADGD